MKVRFLNEQDKFPPNRKLKGMIKKGVKAALLYMAFPLKAEISVLLTDNEGIRVLNAQHREIDKPTDVLSFPMFEYDEAGNIIDETGEVYEKGPLCLGDIVLSLERAKEQAEEYGHSFEREVTFLTVHSMLHLMGYDHMTEEEEKEMFGYQKEIMEEMGILR